MNKMELSRPILPVEIVVPLGAEIIIGSQDDDYLNGKKRIIIKPEQRPRGEVEKRDTKPLTDFVHK